MDVDANMVMQKLATRVAQLELEIAVMQTALDKYQEQEKAQAGTEDQD